VGAGRAIRTGKMSVGKIGKIDVEKLAIFCKRKGFVYPSGEIYGGFAGFWDFGVLGVELKNNIKNEWWKTHVLERSDVVGMDGCVITNPKVWEASGHVKKFSDIYVRCKKCKKVNKLDKNEIGKARCICGGEYERLEDFNLMFPVQVGAGVDSVKTYLRPETAQLIFTNFKLVMDNSRMKLPFGIAQTGKVFRNEISPREFLFRCREFEQMEIEYFIRPKQKIPKEYFNEIKGIRIQVLASKMKKENIMSMKNAIDKKFIKDKWHAYWVAKEFLFFIGLGCDKKNLRIRQHDKEELAHYSSECWDLEYRFPFGWRELEGIADRSDFDLRQHEKFSKADLRVFDEDDKDDNSKKGDDKNGGNNKKKFFPCVAAEPSLGVERAFMVFLFDAYNYDKSRQNIVLKLNPRLAPVKAAVFPIVKKPEFIEIAKKVFNKLRKEFNVVYDTSGTVGRRYSRNDEIGTPYCITVDGGSLKDDTVTIRDRDSTKQVRIKSSNLNNVLRECINNKKSILNFGKLVNTRKKQTKNKLRR